MRNRGKGRVTVQRDVRPQYFLRPARMQWHVRKALGRCERASRVDDLDRIAGKTRHGNQSLRDMHGADDNQSRLRHISIEKQGFAANFDAAGSSGTVRLFDGVVHRRVDGIALPKQAICAISQIDRNKHSPARETGSVQRFQIALFRGPDLPDMHPDASTTGQPDLPCRLIGHTELKQLWAASGNHVKRLGDNRPLDAASGNGALKIAVCINDQMAAGGTRRRAPCLDDSGKRHLPPLLQPFLRDAKRIVNFLNVFGHSHALLLPLNQAVTARVRI
jgi:hypothetical protein